MLSIGDYALVFPAGFGDVERFIRSTDQSVRRPFGFGIIRADPDADGYDAQTAVFMIDVREQVSVANFSATIKAPT